MCVSASDCFVVCCLEIEIVRSVQRVKTAKIVRHGSGRRRGGRFPGLFCILDLALDIILRGTRVVRLRIILVVLPAHVMTILDLFHDDEREFAGLLVVFTLYDLLIVTADDVDNGALFELHLLDALTDRAGGLCIQIDPAAVILKAAVEDHFADPESDNRAVLRVIKAKRGLVVVSLRYDSIGC